MKLSNLKNIPFQNFQQLNSETNNGGMWYPDVILDNATNDERRVLLQIRRDIRARLQKRSRYQPVFREHLWIWNSNTNEM